MVHHENSETPTTAQTQSERMPPSFVTVNEVPEMKFSEAVKKRLNHQHSVYF